MSSKTVADSFTVIRWDDDEGGGRPRDQ